MSRPKGEIQAERGLRLKQVILDKNLTQRQFAQEINISQQTISAMINGNANVTDITAQLVTDKYSEYRYEWLMCIDGFKTHADYEQHQRRELDKIGRAIESAWDNDDIFESVLKSNNIIFKPLDKVSLSDDELPEDDYEITAKLQDCPKYGNRYEVIIDGVHAGKCSFSDRDAICTAVVAYYKFRKQQFDRDISSFIEFEFKDFVESAATQNAPDET